MGKSRVQSILEMTGLPLPKIIVWNRSHAPTELAKRERANAAIEILGFVRRGAVNRPADVNAIQAESQRPSEVKGNGVARNAAPNSLAVIRLQIRENPKIGKSRLRFDCYRDGMTIADYELAVRQRLGAFEASKCKPDLKWDSTRGFIRIECSG